MNQLRGMELNAGLLQLKKWKKNIVYMEDQVNNAERDGNILNQA